MVEFKPKRQYEVSTINALAVEDPRFIIDNEEEYELRVEHTACEIIRTGCTVAMLSGPSASGKTTSAWRLCYTLRSLGKDAHVISLDDFFKNIEDYPKTEDGQPDLENVNSLDLECINETIKQLVERGECDLPRFDFKKQSRLPERSHIKLEKGGIAIIEGIHALNPLLTQSVAGSGGVLNVYVGLRVEFGEDGKRVLATRDLRITRRLVRDFYFRGYSVEDTLSVWKEIMAGEEKWIKPFKNLSDLMLDTSFTYEPCVFAPVMKKLAADENAGGRCRDTLLELCAKFDRFIPIKDDDIPKNSILREFVGGLEL